MIILLCLIFFSTKSSKSLFHFLWLRDNCPTAIHPTAKMRIFNILTVSKKIYPKNIALKNKELNEGFEEKVSSKKTGKIINFFNLGFNNRWQKLLPSDIKEKMNKKFKKELKELNYFYE